MQLIARYYPSFAPDTVCLSIGRVTSSSHIRNANVANDDPRATADILANNCANSLEYKIIATEELPAVPNGSAWTRVYQLG